MAYDCEGNCALCGAKLIGSLGVFEREIGGMFVISIEETSPRNWLQCDACNIVVCHNCCRYPQSGYCDRCIETYHLLPMIEEIHQHKEEKP